MNKIDLRENKHLSVELSKHFNDICKKNRKKYTELIGDISKDFKNKIDWWVSSTASRNTLNSPLFYYYCVLDLVIKQFDDGKKIDEIVVDSPALKQILDKIIKQKEYYCIVTCPVSSTNFAIRRFSRILLYIAKVLFFKINQLFLRRKSTNKYNSFKNKTLTLIDTYAFPDFYSKDRYYNGLIDLLNEEQKQFIYFIPSIVMSKFRDMKKIYEELQSSKRKFLIKEDFINLSDVLFALLHCIRVQFLKIKPIVQNGTDITKLFYEDLYSFGINGDFKSFGGMDLSIEGLLNYRFLKNLKRKGIKIRMFIDWWEGQAIDKGLHIGLNNFFPNTNVVGYFGYIPRPMELQLYPADYELENFVVPKKISVIGKKLINSLKEFSKYNEIFCAPAFRFKKLWENKEVLTDKSYYTIFVALPSGFSDSINILKKINSFSKDNSEKKLRIWIKIHPTINEIKIRKNFGHIWPHIFEIVEGNTYDYLRKSDILISGMSSICLESIALGIPTVVVKQLNGLQYDPVPLELPQELWKYCATENEVFNAIKYFKNRNMNEINHQKKIGAQIREDYFEPITRKGVLNLLELN